VLIGNALKPAEVNEVSLCFELGRATIIVREDQLSLAIGRRGQNVRLAARLTGWDIDILTPEEFAKGLEILEETIKTIEGVDDTMLDRMGALGMISVFDVQDVGQNTLVNDVGMPEELSELVLTTCAEKAKLVDEQQRLEKEQEEQRKADADADAVETAGVEGESAAASILGEAPPVAEPTESATEEVAAEAAAASILDGGSSETTGEQSQG
jgi:N utilization substance protein A